MKEPEFDDTEGGLEWVENLHVWVFRAKLLLRKYWWIFLLTVSIGVFYQGWQEYQREPRYKSHARMIVSGRVAVPDAAGYKEELSNFFGTQIRLMQSQIVINAAHERLKVLYPDLQSSPVGLRAAQEPETSIFVLTAEGGEPRYTQAFLDASLEEYINFKNEARSATSESTLLKINEQLLVLEDEIDGGENALVEFQKDNNIVFIQEQGTSAGSYLARLKNRMAAFKTQFRELESLSLEQHLEGSKKQISELDDDMLQVSVLETSENFLLAKRQYDKLVAERDEFGIYMRPKHPKIINLNLEIERADNLLGIYRKQGLRQLEEQKNVLHTRVGNLEEEIAQWEQTALDYSRLMAEYDRLKSKLERSKNLYERLLASIQQIDLNLNIGQETVRILEQASPPYREMPKIGSKVAQGGVAGCSPRWGFYLSSRPPR